MLVSDAARVVGLVEHFIRGYGTLPPLLNDEWIARAAQPLPVRAQAYCSALEAQSASGLARPSQPPELALSYLLMVAMAVCYWPRSKDLTIGTRTEIVRDYTLVTYQRYHGLMPARDRLLTLRQRLRRIVANPSVPENSNSQLAQALVVFADYAAFVTNPASRGEEAHDWHAPRQIFANVADELGTSSLRERRVLLRRLVDELVLAWSSSGANNQVCQQAQHVFVRLVTPLMVGEDHQPTVLG